MTGLAAKEALEQRQKSISEAKRVEAFERHLGSKASSSQTPPQPRRPARSDKEPPQPATPVPASPDGAGAPKRAALMESQIGMALPTMGNPTVQSMVMQLFNQSKLPGQAFHMVVIPEDDWPRMDTFMTIEELINAIKEQLGSPCHVFPFVGQPMAITTGPNHHLRTPYGMLPLFDIPTAEEVQEAEHGWIGPSFQRPEAPQTTDDEIVIAAGEAAEEEQEAREVQQDAPTVQPVIDQTPVFGD